MALPENLPRASVLVPITREEPEPRIILTRRAEHLSTHKGQVAFPGGKQDPEDTSPLHTALRESREEIGLLPEQVQVVGQLSDVISLHGFKVTPFVGIVDPGLSLQADPNELESIFQVPLSWFLGAEPVRRDAIRYKELHLSVPAYHYETEGRCYEIWGLSAIILVELLNLTMDAGIPLRIQA
jgi:8-oxo-dGTP pyrophosphatase MutT (NUDIX family)